MMVDILSSPFYGWFYIVGVLSAVSTLPTDYGHLQLDGDITVTPRSQQISTYITVGFFVILSVIGVRALLAFI